MQTMDMSAISNLTPRAVPDPRADLVVTEYVRARDDEVLQYVRTRDLEVLQYMRARDLEVTEYMRARDI